MAEEKRSTRYAVIFEPHAQGRWQARVPDLPQVTAVGRTLDEARRALTDSARIYMSGPGAALLQRPRPTTIVETIDFASVMAPPVSGDEGEGTVLSG